MDQYDHDCLPSEYRGDPLTFIKDSTTNKTCSRRLIVSTDSNVFVKKKTEFGFLFIFVSQFVCLKEFFQLNAFQVPKPMKGPVYIYYQLDNFYQNHRRYVEIDQKT